MFTSRTFKLKPTLVLISEERNTLTLTDSETDTEVVTFAETETLALNTNNSGTNTVKMSVVACAPKSSVTIPYNPAAPRLLA